MSQSNFVSLCGYFMSCDTTWLSRLCEFSTLRVFQLSLENIQIIFLELSAGQVSQNCRATLVIPPGTSVATIVTICCNHRHNLLQPSWRRISSTSNNQKTRVDSDINSDYKASSFDKLYIRRRKWDTAGFVRAHQWKYRNELTVGRGHADDGCSSEGRPAVNKSCILLPR